MIFRQRLGKKSDDELMQMLADGNSYALSELYARYSAKLLRYFFRMLWKDESKAEDFLHDLFLKLITNPRHYQKGRNFSTWIYSVANNMCKNEYRKQALRNEPGMPEIIALTINPKVEEDEFLEVLDRALRSLDEDEKNLYALRYEVEMPLEQISVLLDCPVGTVKSRLFYLKKKLAGHLDIDLTERKKYGIQ
jgi:RNA polymerase sigma-70 factor, ECF subfamily